MKDSVKVGNHYMHLVVGKDVGICCMTCTGEQPKLLFACPLVVPTRADQVLLIQAALVTP